MRIENLTEGEYAVYRAMKARFDRNHWMALAHEHKRVGLPFGACLKWAQHDHREYKRFIPELNKIHAQEAH